VIGTQTREMEKEQLHNRDPSHAAFGGPRRGSPGSESEEVLGDVRTQSFLALGKELMLSSVSASRRLPLEEFCKAMVQYLGQREEHAKRHEED
jgi:hypothetical protein